MMLLAFRLLAERSLLSETPVLLEIPESVSPDLTVYLPEERLLELVEEDFELEVPDTEPDSLIFWPG